MRFQVKAVRLDGEQYVETLEAESAAALSAHLRSQGYSVTAVRPVEASLRERLFSPARPADLASAADGLAHFLATGADLPVALQQVADDLSTGQFRQALQEAASDLAGGMSLHEALTRRTRHFPPLFRFAVEAGAATGRLGPALLLVADYYRRADRARTMLVEAAIYPALLLAGAVALSIQAAYFLVPNFRLMFDDMGVELPAPTLVVCGVISHVGEWLPWAILAMLVVLAALSVLARFRPIRYAMDRAILSIPLWGRMLRDYALSRLAAGLGLLLANDAPAPRALRLLAQIEPNLWVQHELDRLADRIEQGSSVADGLSRMSSSLLPNTFRWVLASAGSTHTLADAAERLSQMFSSIAEERLALIGALVGPGVIAFLGFVTLGMAAVLLLPLLRLLQTI